MSVVRRQLIRSSRLSPLFISVAVTATASKAAGFSTTHLFQQQRMNHSQHSRSTTSSSRKFSVSSRSNHGDGIISNKMDLQTWNDGKSLAVQKCVMPLTYDSHKGSSGRIGVLGGSAQYTGAPYYAAMASLKAGADLAFVFCAEEACLPIKSYSPELMVAPVYSASAFDDYTAEENIDESDDGQMLALIDGMVKKVTSKIDNLHALIIGPGMGRCPLVCEATARIIKYAKTKKIALIIDADALWMLAQPQYRSIFEEYDDAPVILTPNVIEYNRLFSNVIQSSSSQFPLQYTTIVKKGQYDIILQNEKKIMACQQKGGKKRSGGIGDVLAGTLGTMIAWNVILSQDGNNAKINKNDLLALSCWSGCCFVKRATELAFEDKRRSMTAPDVLEHLGPAINEMTS